jgi:hypothetical protein
MQEGKDMSARESIAWKMGRNREMGETKARAYMRYPDMTK